MNRSGILCVFSLILISFVAACVSQGAGGKDDLQVSAEQQQELNAMLMKVKLEVGEVPRTSLNKQVVTESLDKHDDLLQKLLSVDQYERYQSYYHDRWVTEIYRDILRKHRRTLR